MRNLFNLLAILICFSCGTEEAPPPQVNKTPPPSTGGGSGGGSGTVAFADIAQDLQTNCGACHGSNQFIRSESAFRSSDAAELIFNRKMPPSPRRLTEEVYQKIIRFR